MFIFAGGLEQTGDVASQPLKRIVKILGFYHMKKDLLYTEDKAKVVAAVWGIYFIQFLAALAVLPPDNMKKRMSRTRMI